MEYVKKMFQCLSMWIIMDYCGLLWITMDYYGLLWDLFKGFIQGIKVEASSQVRRRRKVRVVLVVANAHA